MAEDTMDLLNDCQLKVGEAVQVETVFKAPVFQCLRLKYEKLR